MTDSIFYNIRRGEIYKKVLVPALKTKTIPNHKFGMTINQDNIKSSFEQEWTAAGRLVIIITSLEYIPLIREVGITCDGMPMWDGTLKSEISPNTERFRLMLRFGGCNGEADHIESTSYYLPRDFEKI